MCVDLDIQESSSCCLNFVNYSIDDPGSWNNWKNHRRSGEDFCEVSGEMDASLWNARMFHKYKLLIDYKLH